VIRHRNVRSLNGRWKFKTDPDDVGDFSEPDGSAESWRRESKFFDLAFDDGPWGEIGVPACWHTEGHPYNDGVAWYRTRFDYRPDGVNNVIRLHFKGVDYFCDVWLNGYYLGSHEGFFQHFSHDASRWIREGENLLVVKVENPNVTRLLVKGALMGVNWDANDPEVNPGGISNDVQLLASRDLYIERLKATPFVDLEAGTAQVHCRAVIVNTTGSVKEVQVGAALSPHNFEGESYRAEVTRRLLPGRSETELWLDVDRPELWWPWDMGEQNLYDIALAVTEAGDGIEAAEGGHVCDELNDRLGIRHLHKEQGGWTSYVNGKRIFAKGPNYLSEQFQSNMTRERYEFDLQLMKDANMNMVRVYCVAEREEFYDVCDDMGLMVYQDFPTTGRMSNTGDFLRRAVQQGRELVNQLYNHPSIVIWCWGQQPGIKNFEKLCLALAEACEEEDPYRFIQQGSSVWQWRIAKEKFDWPIDYHLLAGWFHPDDRFGPFLSLERDEGNSGYSVEELLIKRKELLEFVSEYGPPEALPDMESLVKIVPEEDRWPVNWGVYEQRRLHGDILKRWIDIPDSLEGLIEASQDYQALHLKYHTEFYRRHKFEPCNGALFFQFKDCFPGVTASVVDYFGRKKRAYYALQEAFRPLHVLMEWPLIDGEAPGTVLTKGVFVVNDYLREYPELSVRWRVSDNDGTTLQQETLACSSPENALTRVGELAWTVPAGGRGPYRIAFELADASGVLSTNAYDVKVIAGRAAR
jgi:beta-mannosidase